ncbi:hypothetical protein C0J52_05661 [Blattella germanica]|nr:hypothetical protein C0J52_05661 [Blattella germanica]
MGAFCVISIAIHCRREGNCARLPKLPNFRIAGAPIPRPDPAEGGNSTSRQSLRSVLRRCFQSTRYNASRDCLIMNDINEIAETTV